VGGWDEGRLVEEADLDLARPDHDPLHHPLDDLPALAEGQLRPAGVEGAGLGGEVGGRELLDGEEVDLPLEAGDLRVKLPGALFKRPVALPEALGRQLVALVEAVELVHFQGQSGVLP
jgi:hypothetical protein